MSAAVHSNLSQADAILTALLTGQRLTPVLALNLFGCFRLGARIWELKARGHNIETRLKTVMCAESGKTARVAEYFICQEEPDARERVPTN